MDKQTKTNGITYSKVYRVHPDNGLRIPPAVIRMAEISFDADICYKINAATKEIVISEVKVEVEG